MAAFTISPLNNGSLLPKSLIASLTEVSNEEAIFFRRVDSTEVFSKVKHIEVFN